MFPQVASRSTLSPTAWVVGRQTRNRRRGIRTWLSEKHKCALELVLWVTVVINLVINSVQVQPEGMGVYRYGYGWTVPHTLRQGTAGANFGILDLGGGTAIATLVDE